MLIFRTSENGIPYYLLRKIDVSSLKKVIVNDQIIHKECSETQNTH